MPERGNLKLPANILKEIGITNVSASRSRAFKKPNRKISRQTARIEKRRRPASRKILTRFPKSSNQVSSDSHKESLDDSDERDLPSVPNEQSQLVNKTSRADSKTILPRASQELPQDEPSKPRISRQVRAKLAEDDAEIAALERKLGLKRKKKLPTSFDEDGLSSLLGELGELSNDDNGKGHQSERFTLSKDEEDWLRFKRGKATSNDKKALSKHADDMDISDIDTEDSLNHSDELNHDSTSSDFIGFEDEEVKQDTVSKKRENPYIAPRASGEGKYIPPSLRKLQTGETDDLHQLQRQLQGILNRLSEAKVLSIASEIEKTYRENARQHVTTILLDILFPLICDPSPLQDTFMILHGGFVAALYKTIGAEFGAQVIQRAVDEYDEISRMDSNIRGKRLSNLITFLAELYNFHVVGSPLIYDLIRKLTADLSEDNAELLLRIARISGFQLRQDDSASLKDIVTLLHSSVKTIGADNLSIRTKFMIETIENLKNNKVKTGIAASSIRAEHTTAMKKSLGSISRSTVKASEPLRIGLVDIQNADKQGKWWIIGASFKDNTQLDSVPQKQSNADPLTHSSVDNNDLDLDQLAREQGMNTEIRRAIFISLVSAYDHNEACTRLTKLGMKSKQKLEIPKVLVHCVGAEKTCYNRFYTKIAKHLCNERNLRKAFSFVLWDIIKRVEDNVEDEDNDKVIDQLDVTAMVYIGKMYGELVADGLQSILVLKHMDLAHPMSKLKTFAEVFLITIFQCLGSRSKDSPSRIKQIFAVTEQAPEMVAGLQLFLRKSVRKTTLIQDTKSKERVMSGCKMAESVLLDLMSNGVGRHELSNLL